MVVAVAVSGVAVVAVAVAGPGVAAAVSGIVTPPDPTSMIALLIPMYLLYEVGILAAAMFIKHTQAPPEEEKAAQI